LTLNPIPLNFLIYEENFILFFISVDNIHYIHYVQMLSGGVGGRVEYKPPYALMTVSTRSLGIWNMETRSFEVNFLYIIIT
jgi:hypothetical protein